MPLTPALEYATCLSLTPASCVCGWTSAASPPAASERARSRAGTPDDKDRKEEEPSPSHTPPRRRSTHREAGAWSPAQAGGPVRRDSSIDVRVASDSTPDLLASAGRDTSHRRGSAGNGGPHSGGVTDSPSLNKPHKQSAGAALGAARSMRRSGSARLHTNGSRARMAQRRGSQQDSGADAGHAPRHPRAPTTRPARQSVLRAAGATATSVPPRRLNDHLRGRHGTSTGSGSEAAGGSRRKHSSRRLSNHGQPARIHAAHASRTTGHVAGRSKLTAHQHGGAGHTGSHREGRSRTSSLGSAARRRDEYSRDAFGL